MKGAEKKGKKEKNEEKEKFQSKEPQEEKPDSKESKDAKDPESPKGKKRKEMVAATSTASKKGKTGKEAKPKVDAEAEAVHNHNGSDHEDDMEQEPVDEVCLGIDGVEDWELPNIPEVGLVASASAVAETLLLTLELKSNELTEVVQLQSDQSEFLTKKFLGIPFHHRCHQEPTYPWSLKRPLVIHGNGKPTIYRCFDVFFQLQTPFIEGFHHVPSLCLIARGYSQVFVIQCSSSIVFARSGEWGPQPSQLSGKYPT